MGHLGTQNRDHSFKLFSFNHAQQDAGNWGTRGLSVEDTLIKKKKKNLYKIILKILHKKMDKELR